MSAEFTDGGQSIIVRGRAVTSEQTGIVVPEGEALVEISAHEFVTLIGKMLVDVEEREARLQTAREWAAKQAGDRP